MFTLGGGQVKGRAKKKKSRRRAAQEEFSVYVCNSKSMMQKIDAFQAAGFYCRACLKCF